MTLKEWIELLNPRELSVLFWMSVLLVFVLSKKDVRSSTYGVIKALFNLMHRLPMVIVLLYTVSVITLLLVKNIVEAELIKDYLVWVIFGLYPLIFKSATDYKNTSLYQMVMGVFKFSIIPSFIISEYTLSWWAEFLLVPFSALFTGVVAYSATDPKYEPAKKVANGILVIFGIIMIYQAFSSFILKIADIKEVGFWQKMFISIIGVTLHVPLLYFVQIYSLYEQIIVRTNLTKSKRQKAWAAWIIFKYCFISRVRLLAVLDKVSWRAGNTAELELILSEQ